MKLWFFIRYVSWKLLKLISDMFATVAWFGEACSLERQTLPLWLPQKNILMRTTVRPPFCYWSASFHLVNLKGMVNFQCFSSMTLKNISFSSLYMLYVILFHPLIKKSLLLTRQWWILKWYLNRSLFSRVFGKYTESDNFIWNAEDIFLIIKTEWSHSVFYPLSGLQDHIKHQYIKLQ